MFSWWPWKKEVEKVEVTGGDVSVNIPSKSPRAMQRNESRIESIKHALTKPRCVGDARLNFEKELRKRTLLQEYWKDEEV